MYSTEREVKGVEGGRAGIWEGGGEKGRGGWGMTAQRTGVL